jgi:hypothetical protein
MPIADATSPHRRQRAVNRRVQGDIGELSAMEWLASRGAVVWVPFSHSPHVDLMAELGGELMKIQVKTSTFQPVLKSGSERWKVSIATNGGNRSWSGVTKRFDPAQVDYLFVIVGTGRRWFIPAGFVEAAREVTLGGTKYSEFEIEPGTPFEATIYSDCEPNKMAHLTPGECQSGQMDVTVNHTAMPTQVRILPPPSTHRQILLRPKRQATFPKAPCEEAGIVPGDRLRVRADGPGRMVFERIDANSLAGAPTEAGEEAPI